MPGAAVRAGLWTGLEAGSAGPARLIDALHFAGPEDADAVLGGLPEPVLAAGVRSAEHPLAAAVSAHILAAPPGPAAVALAVRAMRRETVADPEAVLRALLHFADPVLDAALFFPEGAESPWWVRRSIVRDRRGPEGRAVIAPEVRARLSAQIERISARLAAHPTHQPPTVEADLLSAALCADDPGLALAALPTAIAVGQPGGTIRALLTLRAHGRGADLADERLHESLRNACLTSSYQAERWRLALRITGSDIVEQVPAAVVDAEIAELFGLDQRWSVEHLPVDPDSWTSPGLCARRYSLPWDEAQAFAASHAGQVFPGLDEAAAREDIPDDVRAAFATLYPRALLFVAEPDAEALAAAQRVALETLNPALRHLAIRQLLSRGLARRSLSVADALRHAAPAAEVLGLATALSEAAEAYYREGRAPRGEDEEPRHIAWWIESEDTAFLEARQEKKPKFTAGAPIPATALQGLRAELRAAIGARLAAAIGDDPARRTALLLQVGAWPGTFDDLLDRIADPDGSPLPPPAGRAHRWPRGVDPAAVLLTFAPAGVTESLLVADSPALRGVFARMLDRGPLPPALLDLALGPDAATTPGGPGDRTALRRALARNPDTGLGLLWQLVERDPAESEVLAAAYFHRAATDDLRSRIILRSEAAGGLHRRLVARLATADADLQLLRPALASEDPLLVHALLRRINTRIDPGHRAAAYAGLARQSGPEAVWALELERAGTLEKMSAAVRASMAAGDAEPLFEAADAERPPGFLVEEIKALQSAETAFGAAGPDVAERIRAALHGRPERWREFAEALLGAADRPLEQILAGIADVDEADDVDGADGAADTADRDPAR